MSTSQKREGGLWTAGFGEIGATLKALQDKGVKLDDLARLRSDPSYAERVARIMLRNGFVGHPNEVRARQLMGESNFFGIEDWSRFFGIGFSDEELATVPEFPWGAEVLTAPCPFEKEKAVSQTHFAFLGLEFWGDDLLTIVKFHELHPLVRGSFRGPRGSGFYGHLNPGETGKPWYWAEEFATQRTCRFRWYLVPRFVPRLFSKKTYEEMVQVMPREYETLFAVEEIAKNVLYFAKNGVYLNITDEWHMRYCGGTREASCRDPLMTSLTRWNEKSKPGHVSVGTAGVEYGRLLEIYVGEDDFRDDFGSSHGLAVSRKI